MKTPASDTTHGSILDHIGNTPLVPLERISAGLSQLLYAKCEQLNPAGSVKDRLALALVEDAEARGLLGPGDTIVEATAGNTGIGLAMVAAVRGYRLVCVLSEKMSPDKIDGLRILGAEVVLAPSVPLDDPRHFLATAERLAAERGWVLADQFHSPANAGVHERTTGPELLAQVREQAGCDPAAFVAGAGTGGTITGVARYLKRAAPACRIVLADPVGSVLARWVRTGEVGEPGETLMEGVGRGAPPEIMERELVDEALEVTDADSVAAVKRLIREEGLLVGGSSGTALVAALEVARRGELEGPLVVLLPDGWDRYRAVDWMRGMGASS